MFQQNKRTDRTRKNKQYLQRKVAHVALSTRKDLHLKKSNKQKLSFQISIVSCRKNNIYTKYHPQTFSGCKFLVK